MSFDALEVSGASGKPMLLFQFTRDFIHWRWTNAQQPQVLLGQTFAPINISASKIRQGTEPAKLTRTITLPHTSPLAALYRPFPPSDPISIIIWQRHDGEPETPVEWVGRVVGAEFEGAQLRLTCQPSSASARRAGRSRAWQRGCPHALYSLGDGLCNVNRATFEISAQILTNIGSKITANAFATLPDGRLAGGLLEWVLPDGTRERRGIDAHVGNEVTLSFPAPSLPVGGNAIAAPGCAHDVTDCDHFFSNINNFGGNPYTPDRSPFDGDPVF
ncbi:MAG: hypothetical protein CVV18_00270 [Gammaproteobacteria bacterium HGW-Gammaproteobacteria-8]|jgi:hypothetical protein|nr:MAG: hypothetical protein CVV18_00270 [Gammaproteobacteria bacterium HGW-Gammaproteobacteria-8]